MMWILRRLRRPDCARVERVLQAYLDGELDDSHAAFVAAHLEHCDRCGIDAEVYDEIKRRLAALRGPTDGDVLERLHRFAGEIGPNGGDVGDGGDDE